MRLLVFLLLLGRAPMATAAERPNIVIVLADDLGRTDLGCYGNTFNETPHIDRLAGEGMRFTQFYAGPVCSPTRANLQSGQDQARFGITQHIPGHRRPFAKLVDPVVPSQLPPEVDTFAERLSAAGYTTGYFGKWHLGGPGHGPRRQGWQTAIETKGNTMPPTADGAAPRRTAEYLTDQAVAFIEAHRERPFLLQVSHHAVHIPLSTTPELLAKYERKTPMPDYPSNPAYAGLLEELDRSVGRIVETIDRAGLGKRTLIWFLSDNGGLEHEQSGRIVTSNRPFRGEKGTLYEGGIRIPSIVRRPGAIAPGRTCDVPASTHDVYPTLLAQARATAAAGQPLDGVDLSPLFADERAAPARDALYWHLPHYHHGTPASAVRRGDWKLLEFFEDGSLELYDLRTDPGESTNLATRDPARAKELHGALIAWRNKVGARMPRPNPAYDPARAAELGKSKNREAR